MKPNVIIAGDEIRAGVDMDDVEQTGAIRNAMVITFDSRQDMAQAMQAGSVAFDVMRADDRTHDISGTTQ